MPALANKRFSLAKITYYDYANFVLFADDPWDFDHSSGAANNGYVVWLDIDDPIYPKIDIMKKSEGISSYLPGNITDVPVTPDILRGEWFSWRLEKEPNTLKVYLNDALFIDTYDDQFAFADSKFGLSFGEDSQGYFDEFTIAAAPVPEPAALILFALSLLGFSGFQRKRIPF